MYARRIGKKHLMNGKKLQLDFAQMIGLDMNHVYQVDIASADRAHYSKQSVDTEFDFPFGQKELWGLAYRTDYDLSAHAKSSGAALTISDEEGKPALVPHVIEPSFGVDRTILAVLTSAYTEDTLGNEPRTYSKFNKAIAPIKAAVFPLLKEYGRSPPAHTHTHTHTKKKKKGTRSISHA